MKHTPAHAGRRPAVISVLLAALCLAAPAGRAAPADTARTAAWFDAHKDRPPLLRNFLQRLPKGADLHSHVSGAVYAESYLRWAAEDGACVDADKLAVTASCATDAAKPVPARELTLDKNAGTYAALVDRMSTRNLASAGRSGHDQFFDAFAAFPPNMSTPARTAAMVVELSDRAAAQRVLHLELMSTLRGSEVRKLGAELPWATETDFTRRRQWLLDHGLTDLVAGGRQDLDAVHAALAEQQRCASAQARPGCTVSLRWLQQTTRTAAPEAVFAQLAFAFELARSDNRVAGINLVAPEDNPVALRDYRLQMEMIGFLSKLAPNVKIALHAGELVLGLVPPEHLRSHIRDAVLVAGAHRIGHAVDIGHEDGAQQTLTAMRERGVAVEICLTSNDVILGVKGRDHPLPEYLAAGVQVVLASDDEGISRIDLSNEYQRAVQTHGLGYRQLKQLSRNSLQHSFLPGASLWHDASRAVPVAACRRDVAGARAPSVSCKVFLDGSERAQRQWALEQAFEAFEKLPDWRPPGLV